jgi:hypothetical protein
MAVVLVSISITIWYVGRYLNLNVPCSTWSLLRNCVPGVGDLALVILPYYVGGSVGEIVENLANELSEMDALLSDVRCKVVLCLASRLGDECLYFILGLRALGRV